MKAYPLYFLWRHLAESMQRTTAKIANQDTFILDTNGRFTAKSKFQLVAGQGNIHRKGNLENI
jgi:hypothetical protein